jgi:hypothetical protein
LAREAAVLAAVSAVGDPDAVGDHLGIEVDGERVLTHVFSCLASGYPGWRWAVTVVRASRAREVTVDEVVLLPGADALLAPGWLPWDERVRPGDLGPGDLLPAAPDDPRLDPGYTTGSYPADSYPTDSYPTDSRPADAAAGEEAAADFARVADELGLGRARVLSPFGRDDAATRWADSEAGPDSELARAAPAHCSTCGFLVSLAGPLRPAFGVCGNAMSPLDARVVALDSGCGAHSEGGDPGSADYRSATAIGDPVLDEVSLAEFSLAGGAPDEGTMLVLPATE